jgi:cytochrome b6-f complex iron-sulfur subunit
MTQTTDPVLTDPTDVHRSLSPHADGSGPCGSGHACHGLTRRSVLRGAGAASLGAAALVLAACAGPSDGEATDGAEGDASAGSSGTEGFLAKVADVPVGGALSVQGPDDVPLVLMQPTEGTVVALSAVCTHQGCTVVPDGDVLVCPCHGSVFSKEDGSATKGPAEEPLAEVSVKVVDGEVLLA